MQPETRHSETGGPARLTGQVLGNGDTETEIVYGAEKNILHWADQSSQGRIKVSCTGTKEGPVSLQFLSPHLPQLRTSVSRVHPSLVSLNATVRQQHSKVQ